MACSSDTSLMTTGTSVRPAMRGGAPAALARDDLIVAGRKAADRQRLDNAVLADGIGQILQSLFIEVAARLIGVGFDLRDGEVEVVGRVGAQGGVAQQCAEPLAEPAVCILPWRLLLSVG